MSTLSWEEIRDSATALAHKVTKKADELADTAAIRIRLAAGKSHLEEEYAKLGELTYDGMTVSDGNDETVARRIHEEVDRITALKEEIEALETQLQPHTKETKKEQ